MPNDGKGARLESKQILRAIKQRKSWWDQKVVILFGKVFQSSHWTPIHHFFVS